MFRIKNAFLIGSLVTVSSLFMLSGCDDTEKKANISNQSQEVNVYSARLPELIKPIFEAFTKETDIKVNFIFLKEGALERLKSEAELTMADAVLVSDIGAMKDIVDADLVAPIDSDIIKQNIPSNYIGNDNLWVGLTGRIRMLARTTKDLPISINSYDALSAPEMKGKVCTRSFTHPYNISLVSTYIIDKGYDKAQKWLQSFKDNLFDKPAANDTAQIDLIAKGICDLAPVNHYYYEQLKVSNPEIVKKVTLVPLSEMTDGAYMNISGIMLTKYAENKDNAVKLIEFMTSPKAQKIFGDHDAELPLNPSVSSQLDLFKSGTENIKNISLNDIAEKREESLKIIYNLK